MAKDSHGLYNDESHNVAKTIYTPSDNSYLYKAIDEVILSDTIMNELEKTQS